MAKKNFLDSIKVPAPCDKKWDEMDGDDQKRFCSGCQKNVHNISAMPRREARRLVAQNAGKICIRYERLPNGKVLTDNQPLTQISRRSSAVAAGVIAATLTLSALTYAQDDRAVIGTTSAAISHKQTDKKSRSISFTIYDTQDALVPQTQVTLVSQKSKEKLVITANQDGIASFYSVVYGKYLITVSRPGFANYENSIEINERTASEIKIDLKLPVQEIIGDFTINDSETLPDSKKAKNKSQSRNSSDTSQISFTIYDPRSEIISGAQITLTNQRTKAEFDSVTNRNGVAQFGQVPHGIYEVFISSSAGFLPFKQSIQIKEAIEPNIKITLEVTIAIGVFTIDWSEIPLFQAISQQDNESVKKAINSGFNLNTKDSSKHTALHIAIEHKNLEIVRFLLERGAKVNVKDKYGISPILMLDEDLDDPNAVEVLKLLITKGANVNARNENQETLLMLACENENLAVAKILLAAKANPNLKDEDGETAYQKTESEEIKRLLIRYRAHQR